MATPPTGNPEGRPTEYTPEFCQVVAVMAANGATMAEMADEIGVSERTLWRWKAAHPEFRQSIVVSRDVADERVENALYHRAIGYSLPSVKIMTVDGKVHVEPYVEHLPPDTAAASLWLRNRKSGEWKDKQESEVKHSFDDDMKAWLARGGNDPK